MGLLNDTSTYSPGVVNGLSYNNWVPTHTSFPLAGGSYTDPVFNEVVTRLTVDSLGEFNYSFHYANCDGTKCFSRLNGVDWDIVSLTSFAVMAAAQPDGSSRVDCRWDQVSSDVYHYYSSSYMVSRNVVTGTSVTTNQFPTVLAVNGGSLNTQSADGRYFLVRYSGTMHVWDRQNDAIYTGNVPVGASDEPMGLTPDAKWIYGPNFVSGPLSQQAYKCFEVNHATSTADTTGIFFFDTSVGSGHGTAITASNGTSYLILNHPETEEIVTATFGVDRSSATTPAAMRAFAGVEGVFPYDDAVDFLHNTGVSKGEFQDWFFASIESTDDVTNGSETFGRMGMMELVAFNVVTGDNYRLAHLRCQGVVAEWEPRVTCSADGSLVLWWSTFNQTPANSVGDLYGIFDPLDAFAEGEASTISETIVTFGGSRVTVRFI